MKTLDKAYYAPPTMTKKELSDELDKATDKISSLKAKLAKAHEESRQWDKTSLVEILKRVEKHEYDLQAALAREAVLVEAATAFCNLLLDSTEPICPFHARSEYPHEFSVLLNILSNTGKNGLEK